MEADPVDSSLPFSEEVGEERDQYGEEGGDVGVLGEGLFEMGLGGPLFLGNI